MPPSVHRSADSPDPDAERLLAVARPCESVAFRAATERKLFGPGRAPRARRPRTLAAAFGLSGALAAAALIAGLTGAGPLDPGGSSEVRAKQDCRVLTVVRTQPEGQIVEKNGVPTVVGGDARTPRTITHCK